VKTLRDDIGKSGFTRAKIWTITIRNNLFY